MTDVGVAAVPYLVTVVVSAFVLVRGWDLFRELVASRG